MFYSLYFLKQSNRIFLTGNYDQFDIRINNIFIYQVSAILITKNIISEKY